MEIACHPSYPRNSDMASPPGTFAAYLSWAEMANPPRTASHSVIPIVNMYLRFIAGLLRSSTRIAREHEVTILGRCVTGEAGLERRTAVSLAVGELREPPAPLR